MAVSGRGSSSRQRTHGDVPVSQTIPGHCKDSKHSTVAVRCYHRTSGYHFCSECGREASLAGGGQSSNAVQTNLSRLSPELNPTPGMYNSQTDWDVFDFFLESALQAGPLPTAHVFSLVAQVASRDATIRTICRAIGALHLSVYSSALGPEQNARVKDMAALSLELYGEAVRTFREGMSTTDLANTTILPVLFATFDLCYGDTHGATVHLKHAILLSGAQQISGIASFHVASKPSRELEVAAIDMLLRLTTHPNLGASKSAMLDDEMQDVIKGFRRRIRAMPSQFIDLGEALRWWTIVQQVVSYEMKFALRPGDDTFSLLQTWHTSFNSLLLRCRMTRSSRPYVYVHTHILESLYLELLTALYGKLDGPRIVLPDVRQIYLDVVGLIQETLEGELAKLDLEVLMKHSLVRTLVYVAHKAGAGLVRERIKTSMALLPQAWYIVDTFSPIKTASTQSGGLGPCETSRDWFFTSLGCGLDV